MGVNHFGAQMTRKRRGNPISGVVLVDKPAGVSANAVVQRIKRLYKAQKAGHTGTLDPFATGLLPVCLGEATKASAFQLNAEKCYRATLQLGQRTDTADCEGEVVQTRPVPPLDRRTVEAVLTQFEGEIQQVPPIYSALKKNGKPLYEYARQGQNIEIEPRQVTIHQLTLLTLSDNRLTFEVRASKGTYIRTLGEDIAQALGTVGHLTQLRRLESGGLNIRDAWTLAHIEADPTAALQPLTTLLPHLPQLEVTAAEAERLRHGNPISLATPEVVLVMQAGVPVCIGERRNEQLWPKRLFNL